MILLTKSTLDSSLYKVGILDAPGNGSTTSLYQNVIESCSLLNPFEDVYKSINERFTAYGYSIFDDDDFSLIIKPFYQILRHGLSFDWVLNHVMCKIRKVFPFCHFQKFNGTADFLSKFENDPIFTDEISYLDAEFNKVLDQLFSDSLNLDSTVFTRLSIDAKSEDFTTCVLWARDNNKVPNYIITEEMIYKMNYLVALGLMLEKSIGFIKRAVWHVAFDKIQDKTMDSVIICGGKFRSFAYGDIWGSGVAWHKFDLGIRYDVNSSRSQKKEFIRAYPDEMTFFRFSPISIIIDESYFPLVSINGGKWLDTLNFTNETNIPLDKTLRLRIKYKFPQVETSPRTIKIKAKANCVVKDYELVLDLNGEAETQVIFRGDSIGFKIAESLKEYPFAVFNNSKLKIKEFDWLT